MYIKSKLLISLQASGNIQHIFPLWDRKQLHHTYIHILDINTRPRLALALWIIKDILLMVGFN